MSTLKIQELNSAKSTTMTLELREAGSVFGGVFGPGGFVGFTNPSGAVFGPGGFAGFTNPSGAVFGPGGFAGFTNPSGAALSEG